jgi:diphthine synthase
MSLKGLEEARSSDIVFAEFYTSFMPGLSLQNLEKLIGKPVNVLSRVDVEEKAEEAILKKVMGKRAAFLVPGDPMVATTHVSLRLNAEKAGIKTKVIHGASIVSAVSGATGLQNYKFGRTVTIPVPDAHPIPESPYDYIKENLSRGLHTLAILDIKAELGIYMRVHEALNYLLLIEERRRGNVITERTLAVGLARVGSDDMKVKADSVKKLMTYNFGDPPHCLIIPGRLHFMEIEALQVLAGAGKEILEGYL